MTGSEKSSSMQSGEPSLSVRQDPPRPLKLLNLPVDILQAIIKEITHTNDLTALSLTHSALHGLVIPHIYSRFDIVWPESNPRLDTRDGVDALTYGLATLVMTRDVFGENYTQKAHHAGRGCRQCSNSQSCSDDLAVPRPPRIRRGNHFAQHTRKFSLGNGPSDWVHEYAINREGGKMLGTLIALAVGQMRNLESFQIDMPSGVLRDVFLALASLDDREDGQDCRLERIWIRWHDNSAEDSLNAQHRRAANPTLLPRNQSLRLNPALSPSRRRSLFNIPAYPRVEFPTFSVLPPLKSLSVLDIDEQPYVEEMSVLLETSIDKIRELRLGVARHAQFEPWLRPVEDSSYAGLSSPPSSEQTLRPGGILGILVARICDQFDPTTALEMNPEPTAETSLTATENAEMVSVASMATSQSKPVISKLMQTLVSVVDSVDGVTEEAVDQDAVSESPEVRDITQALTSHHLDDSSENREDKENPPALPTSAKPPPNPFASQAGPSKRNKKLMLETLELERIPISIPVLSKAIDWSNLTTLTILSCRSHEQLWKALRKRFAPPLITHSRSSSLSLKTPAKVPSVILTPLSAVTPKLQPLTSASYPLKLTYLHTDMVSPSLLTFVHATLEPETLTHLFLQESHTYKSLINLEQIHKSCIRRHRTSLRKLLIDSTFRTDDLSDGHPTPDAPNGTEPLGVPPNSTHWLATRDLITTLTSPKSQVRELSLALDYRDWHFFLQRLASAPTIRSLHVTYIHNHPHNPPPRAARTAAGISEVVAKELALQILDIVALKPEMELCYLAVLRTCFEVVEFDETKKKKGKQSAGVGSSAGGAFEDPNTANANGSASDDDNSPVGGAPPPLHPSAGFHAHDPAQFADEEDNHDHDPESDPEDLIALSETTTDDEDTNEQRDGSGIGQKKKKGFKLREILFYDDKVSIFRARHGRL